MDKFKELGGKIEKGTDRTTYILCGVSLISKREEGEAIRAILKIHERHTKNKNT